MKLIKAAHIPANPPRAEGEIILRETSDGFYVTHFHNLQSGGFAHGHYFKDLDEAIADFDQRVADYKRSLNCWID